MGALLAPPTSPSVRARFSNLKYLLYVPLAATALLSRAEETTSTNWCLHILLLTALRALLYQLWYSYANMLFFTRRRRVVPDGVDFAQADLEWHWDSLFVTQAVLASSAFVFSNPAATSLPPWRGAAAALLLHAGAAEPLYYLAHRRWLHAGAAGAPARAHSLHHSSSVPQPVTAGFGTALEHLLLTLVMAVPLAGAFALGVGSTALLYGYTLVFDFLRAMGYSNVEIISFNRFQAFPLLRYLIYTPTYLSLHHRLKDCNFCLFMPLFDLLGGTAHPDSWRLQKENFLGKNQVRSPDFVFLAHIIDVISSSQAPCAFRSISAHPFAVNLAVVLLWPVAFLFMLAITLCSKTFLVSFYTLRGRMMQTWSLPRYGFQYFLPFAKDGINKEIELAILRADRIGVKVFSLAALNKNEALNGGGSLYVDKHRELRVRVVHGNTLTAAVIVNEIPPDTKEVFLTGATSKIGRAVALYLCRKKIRVLMMTMSAERFANIQKEAPPEFQEFLLHVTKFQAAESCKTWIVGKWLSWKEQQWAPAGTHFHQFVVPPIAACRRDCSYGKQAAMRLPRDVQGLGTCEYTMERGVVHACHAGGVVHLLEGWTHHEVGAVDVDRIDAVWATALKHGFSPA